MTTMADVGRGVISERNELHATGWKDCTQASAMRCCADAGIVFPLADLDLEREALERADDYPDETGATMAAIVTAMERRYGYSGSPVSDLHAALRTPGYTLLVQGTSAHFPSYQRRWDPSFANGHSVAYRVLSDLGGTLLDPMAPMGFAGDTVTPALMEAFAWGASTTRAMKWMEATVVPKAITSETPATMTVAKGAGWFDLDGKTKLATGSSQLDNRFSPYACSALRAMFASAGGLRRIVLVTPATGSVKPIVDPDAATIAVLRGQLASAAAALTAAQAKIAAAKTANAAAVTANAAVRSALG